MIFDRQQRLQETLPVRSRCLARIRNFFIENGYLEVDTPVCIPAPLPEPHINAPRAACGYLQPSPEACMKQLLAAGFSKLFQICKCFRESERGSRHLPEFTLLEWYGTGHSHEDLMHTCELMLEAVLRDVSATSRICYQSKNIDFTRPWPRLTVSDAFARFAKEDMAAALSNGRFDEHMGLSIEPCLGLEQPVFLYDYPSATSPLASPRPDNPEIARRFELYIGGIEICNGCTELKDPAAQEQRFKEELDSRRRAGLPESPFPRQFLETLQLMPAAAGCALGIDRLLMLLTDSKTIDEVVAFTPETL